ncbi:meiotic nuclear division protein 1 homolog [Episyrphus balteatus]|uniref:meiotic nuclear division protein 1 homolog n=1 Tax=Episyrphus balteatus TaxID=286459 RepID=UPI0024855BFA|nr:meiotic nuclear division protein 1 homolog [Episyrphus balteatus]
MSKKKPLSAEEKRTKMLELFHESQDVFQLKDLEKIAPKEKGITQQSVKGVVTELADDGIIDSEKIGTSVYYWAFPKKSINDLRSRLRETEFANVEAGQKVKELEESLKKASEALENIDEVTKIQNEVTLLKVEKTELEKELNSLGENDPELLAAKEDEIKKLFEAANRWTDNIFYIKSWCKTKFGKEDKELDKGFGIPEDLDYLQE